MIRTFLAALVVLIPAAARAQDAPRYADPHRFDNAIAKFEAEDAETPPPENAIVCIGSSSMRGWKTIEEDLAPLTLIHRGFGGSNMNDALHFADRIVINYKPRAILLYEGDNDVAARIPPEQILATYEAFVTRVRNALPDVRIYCLSVKPSVRRWAMWDAMQRTNTLLAESCAADPLATFIDIGPGMLTPSGAPDSTIFVKDMLHMNPEGYAAWTRVVRPILLQAESGYEK